MDPIQLLIYVVVIIVLIIVVFWLLNHFMFIAPLVIEHQITYHETVGGITQSLL